MKQTKLLHPNNVDNESARIANKYIGFGKGQFRRHTSILIKVENGKKIIRKAKGNPGIKEFKHSHVGLSYESYAELGIRPTDNANVEVRRANFLDSYLYRLSHPDSDIRNQQITITIAALFSIVSLFF
ncbi:hypothetical protein [Vibrio barjaei]|uniref:hypothetical protein n=1 Tax=Vibrio barjaei TaxID=1676683 RepID=UPI002284A5F8|nr:hypothetical protein [Vibrio barjaei]MCY9872995.1 hypothetical protein [Vibrio barjaei]